MPKRTSNSAGSSPVAFAPASKPGRSAAKSHTRVSLSVLAIATGLLVLTTGMAVADHLTKGGSSEPTSEAAHCEENPTESYGKGGYESKEPKTCDKPKEPKEVKPPAEPPPPPPPPPPTPPPPRSAPPAPPQATPPVPAPPTPPKLKTRPRLAVSKAGPARLVAGGRARFIIKVHNRGNAAARGVIVSDVLPRGFFVRSIERPARAAGKWKRIRTRISGTGRLVTRVGSIGPKRTIRVRVTLSARRGVRGRRCNVALVTGANVPREIARTCMRMLPPPRRKAPPRTPSVTG